MAIAKLNIEKPKLSAEEQLVKYRSQIDMVDDQIVGALAVLVRKLILRNAIVGEVKDVKAELEMAAEQPGRFQDVRTRVVEMATTAGVSPELVTGIYDLIHQDSIAQQANLTVKPSTNGQVIVPAIETVQTSDTL